MLTRNPSQLAMGFKGGVAGKLGAVTMAAVSPAFVAFLLLKVRQKYEYGAIYLC